jgi:hypothetical protein
MQGHRKLLVLGRSSKTLLVQLRHKRTVWRKRKMAGAVSIFKPTLEIKSPGVSFQLKFDVSAGRGHCLLASEACKLVRSNRKSDIVESFTTIASPVVAKAQVSLLFTRSVFHYPLPGSTILRLGVTDIRY